MTSSPTLAEDPDLRAAVIADAATRLGILRRLADLGMRLAEEVVTRAVDSPYHPEPKHEPARAFAAVSRSVRLTLVLQEKVETRLVALRNGAAIFVDEAAAVRAKAGNGAAMNRAAPEDTPGDAADEPDRLGETLRERESERFDDRVRGPVDDCIAVIRADFGLKPGDDIPAADESVERALGNVLEAACAAPAAHGAPISTGSIAGVGAKALEPADSG